MRPAPNDSLASLQQRLARVITAPDGLDIALAADSKAFGVPISDRLRADRGVAETDRLAVYAHAWFTRIHDCLRDDFGALAWALGADAFHDLVRSYLILHPPTRGTLRHAGLRLAEHLEGEPFATIFARRCPFAASLARVEWSLAEAFFAVDSPVLSASELASIPAEDWPDLRFRVSASLSRLELDWPIDRLLDAYHARSDDDPEPAPRLEPDPTRLRIWRQTERVFYRRMSDAEAAGLAVLASGGPFDAVCAAIAETGRRERTSATMPRQLCSLRDFSRAGSKMESWRAWTGLCPAVPEAWTEECTPSGPEMPSSAERPARLRPSRAAPDGIGTSPSRALDFRLA